MKKTLKRAKRVIKHIHAVLYGEQHVELVACSHNLATKYFEKIEAPDISTIIAVYMFTAKYHLDYMWDTMDEDIVSPVEYIAYLYRLKSTDHLGAIAKHEYNILMSMSGDEISQCLDICA